MSAKKTRRTVDPEFKRAALKLVMDNPDRSKTSIARELGIEPNALYAWVAEAKKHPEHAFPG